MFATLCSTTRDPVEETIQMYNNSNSHPANRRSEALRFVEPRYHVSRVAGKTADKPKWPPLLIIPYARNLVVKYI